MWVGSLGQEDPLEKEMATHSSILAWRVPMTAEPGGLQSMGSQRVGHDLVTKQPFLCGVKIPAWHGSSVPEDARGPGSSCLVAVLSPGAALVVNQECAPPCQHSSQSEGSRRVQPRSHPHHFCSHPTSVHMASKPVI